MIRNVSRKGRERLESFNERLRALRIDAKLSQQDMADALGISRSGYQMIENGKNGKKFFYLPVIAKALSCRIDDLFPDMDSEAKTVCADGFEDETMEGWSE